MTTIRLADGLSLTADAATETFLVVGKRGSGKSSTATRIAEGFIHAKVPIAVLDPVDVWWGLKAWADGSPNTTNPVYIFGGEHFDLPLEPTAGTLMADTVVDHRINAVFVLRAFSNRDKARFVSEFAEQLYKRNRGAMHLFCEEAHEVMPQNPYGGEEEMLGRMIRIAKLGRTSGIGVSAITQRPASLSKNFTTQAEVLIAHRITGPQDNKAVDGWIEHHEQQDLRKDVLSSLPTLKTGEAWFWAPDFPEEKPIGLRRVQVLLPDTFDSRRTPKPGERRREPKSLAPVDLEKLGEKMTATRERAKQSDPRLLQARVRELEAQVRADLAANTALAKTMAPPKIIEKSVLKDSQITRLEKALAKMESTGIAFSNLVLIVSNIAHDMKAALSAASSTPAGYQAPTAGRDAGVTPHDGAAVRATASVPAREARPTSFTQEGARPQRHSVRSGARATSSPNGISARQQRFLDATVALSELGVETTRETVSAWLGVHPRGGSVGQELNALVDAGLIDYDRGKVLPTSAGLERAAPISTYDAIEQAKTGLAPRQRRIFDIIVKAYPKTLTREGIAEEMGIHPRGGSFGEDLGRLRGRGLVTYERGEVRARDFLFAGEVQGRAAARS